MSDGGHPCGGLAVSGWSVHAWFCHEHQAWWASHTCYTQNGGDAVEHDCGATVQFGPFDSSTDVQNWCMEAAGCIDVLAHPDDCDCPACVPWCVIVIGPDQ